MCMLVYKANYPNEFLNNLFFFILLYASHQSLFKDYASCFTDLFMSASHHFNYHRFIIFGSDKASHRETCFCSLMLIFYTEFFIQCHQSFPTQRQ